MNDDEILAKLGQHVRDDQAHDAALVDVARGTRDATSVGAAEDDEVRAMAEASRPLGDAFEAKVAARATAALAPRVPARAARFAKLDVRRLGRIAAPLALAAAVLVWIGTQRAPEDEGPTLPEYALSVRGDVDTRGEEAPAPAASARLRVASATSSFEIGVRPAEAATDRVAAWAFTFAEPGADPTPLAADVEVSPQGAVRIRGKSSALAGAREIRVVLAPARATKFDAAVERARSGIGDAHVRVLTIAVER